MRRSSPKVVKTRIADETLSIDRIARRRGMTISEIFRIGGEGGWRSDRRSLRGEEVCKYVLRLC